MEVPVKVFLALALKILGPRFWITIIIFYGIWMDFKLLGLWIWISIVTGLGLENTWTTNLGYDYY